jgi:hypothetical protein
MLVERIGQSDRPINDGLEMKVVAALENPIPGQSAKQPNEYRNSDSELHLDPRLEDLSNHGSVGEASLKLHGLITPKSERACREASYSSPIASSLAAR